jgi:hypothetical protein
MDDFRRYPIESKIAKRKIERITLQEEHLTPSRRTYSPQVYDATQKISHKIKS